MTTKNQLMNIVNRITVNGIDGAGPLCSAVELAEQYEVDSSYESVEECADALIRWEGAKSFGTGFVSGLGGLVTLPVSIPAGLYASWVVQARTAAAVARLYGYNPDDERVRTLVLMCLIGNAGKEVMKAAGIAVGNKLGMKTLERVSGRALIAINKRVGFRLLTKAGEKGVINLVKFVPLVGGVVAGAIDSAGTAMVGKTAKAAFGA